MNEYIVIENNFFQIYIPKLLKKYGNEVLKYSTDKMKEYLDFFNKENYGEKIKNKSIIFNYS